jgi:hypothetical protein
MRSIALLQENWVDEEKRRDYRAGAVWAATINSTRTSNFLKPSDAFPRLVEKPSLAAASLSEKLAELRRYYENKESE